MPVPTARVAVHLPAATSPLLFCHKISEQPLRLSSPLLRRKITDEIRSLPTL
jgi:hypothetical protein